MRLGLAVRGDLRRWATALSKAVDLGSRKALRITTMGMRKNLRGRINRAGFRSKGLAKGLAAKVEGRTRGDLVGRVYSVAKYKAGPLRSGPVDLIQLYQEGAVIVAANGRWLAIPTGNGSRKQGRGGSRWATPKELRAQGWKTAIIPARNGNMVVVARRGAANVVTHVLVRQVTLRKRYDLEGGVALWRGKFKSILAGEINKAGADIPG